MEKTKIITLTTALALITAVIVGAAYAQTLNTQRTTFNTGSYSQIPSSTTGYYGTYGDAGYHGPRMGGYAFGAPQSGYPLQYGMGMRGGMMGGFYR